MSIPTILDDLATAAKKRADELRSKVDVEELRERAFAFEKRDFLAALKKPGLSVISEIKRASPSAGFIRDMEPSEQGGLYEERGASCLSVLTEPDRFKGSLEDLDAARVNTNIPVIRKDFTVDEIHVLEAATRADAVLLIAALFDGESLERYLTLAEKLGLAALVEIHDEREADLALEAGAEVIGVNNRDLRDFTVDLGTFEKLAPKLEGATLVAESGVKSVEDARRMWDAGADAVLVGEAAMREAALISALADIR